MNKIIRSPLNFFQILFLREFQLLFNGAKFFWNILKIKEMVHIFKFLILRRNWMCPLSLFNKFDLRNDFELRKRFFLRTRYFLRKLWSLLIFQWTWKTTFKRSILCSIQCMPYNIFVRREVSIRKNVKKCDLKFIFLKNCNFSSKIGTKFQKKCKIGRQFDIYEK